MRKYLFSILFVMAFLGIVGYSYFLKQNNTAVSTDLNNNLSTNLPSSTNSNDLSYDTTQSISAGQASAGPAPVPTNPATTKTTTTSTKPAPSSTPIKKTPTPTPTPTSSSSTSQGMYKNGTYTGSVADAFYGNVQVRATISNGQLTNVQFLQYPNDARQSQLINSRAVPMLESEAIQAQSAKVNIVSGATETSGAFRQSLASALSAAKA